MSGYKKKIVNYLPSIGEENILYEINTQSYLKKCGVLISGTIDEITVETDAMIPCQYDSDDFANGNYTGYNFAYMAGEDILLINSVGLSETTKISQGYFSYDRQYYTIITDFRGNNITLLDGSVIEASERLKNNYNLILLFDTDFQISNTNGIVSGYVKNSIPSYIQIYNYESELPKTENDLYFTKWGNASISISTQNMFAVKSKTEISCDNGLTGNAVYPYTYVVNTDNTLTWTKSESEITSSVILSEEIYNTIIYNAVWMLKTKDYAYIDDMLLGGITAGKIEILDSELVLSSDNIRGAAYLPSSISSLSELKEKYDNGYDIYVYVKDIYGSEYGHLIRAVFLQYDNGTNLYLGIPYLSTINYSGAYYSRTSGYSVRRALILADREE